jgi:hypothetical protein
LRRCAVRPAPESSEDVRLWCRGRW